jgi:hypothetical protein
LYYRAIVTDANTFCANPTSAAASVTVYEDAVINVSIDNPQVCVNDLVLLSSSVTGGSGSYTYQWQQSPNGSTGWANIGGATSSTYTPGTSTAGVTYYRLILTDANSFCANPTSSVSSVTVYNDATVSVSANNPQVCLNDAVTISSSITGGSGSYTYQWQQSADGSTGWTNISGATTANYNPPTSTAGTLYYRVLITDTNTFCANPTSTGASVTVFNDATVSASANNPEVCLNDAVILSSSVNGGSGSFTYQWQQSPNGSTGWTNISGATNATHTPPTTSAGVVYYRILVNDANGFCADPTSAAASVTVYNDATVSATADNPSVCLNDAVVLSANVSGGSGSFTYQWQQSPDGSTGWAAIGGATSATYVPATNVAGVFYFRVSVNDANGFCASPTSVSASVTVYEDAVASASANNSEVCLNDAVTISSSVTGGSGSFTYQWQQSAKRESEDQ